MKTVNLVLTCIGEDREGLVEALAQAVQAHGGNWLESRMARLGGRFAGILQVDVPVDKETALRGAFSELGKSGLRIVVETTARSPRSQHPIEIELVGQDRPGIIHEISRVLASNGVNVEELDTSYQNAPETGETLFMARALVFAPTSVNYEKLSQELESIALDLMVDIVIENADSD